MRKPLVLIALGIATMLTIGADDCANVDDNPKPSKNAKPSKTKDKKAPPAKQEPSMTPGQRNALQSAKDYIDYTAFSKSGLIDQLTQTEGYSRADATFAVSHLNANWNQQAYRSAKDYLDYTSFSLPGLIDQLAQTEGYTQAQAEYGANKAYGE